jgi:hypothetical protein
VRAGENTVGQTNPPLLCGLLLGEYFYGALVRIELTNPRENRANQSPSIMCSTPGEYFYSARW